VNVGIDAAGAALDRYNRGFFHSAAAQLTCYESATRP
jgi:hypothetical protein